MKGEIKVEINDATILEALKKGIIDGVDTVKSDFLSENDTDCAERTVDFGATVVNAMDRAIEALKNGNVRHGMWMEICKISDQSVSQKCSCCSNTIVMNIAHSFGYCPACGARMDLNCGND